MTRTDRYAPLRNKKGLQAFAAFLTENGATISDPTNPYEVIRYRFNGSGTVIVWKKANGSLTVPDDAMTHLQCFAEGRAIERKKRPGKRQKDEIVEALIERDGSDCCICGDALGQDITVEHWISIRHGGTNALPNLGLAHAACNHRVDSLPITEKIKVAVDLRREKEKRHG